MRILLDESLPVALARKFPAHDVSTVRRQRWIGLRNGVLLRAAADAGFDVLITADQSLPTQQNLRSLRLAEIVLVGTHNNIVAISSLVPQIEIALMTIKAGDVLRVSPRGDSIGDRPLSHAWLRSSR